MKRSLVEIYALAVCFITVTCFAIAAGIAIYDLVQISSPEITLHSHRFETHQSNEAFRNSYTSSVKGLSENEVTKRREESFRSALNSERRDGWQSLLRMGIFMLVSVIFFVFHWLLAKRVRESSVGT